MELSNPGEAMTASQADYLLRLALASMVTNIIFSFESYKLNLNHLKNEADDGFMCVKEYWEWDDDC